MRHPFEYAAADEACDGCWRHVCRIGLPARDKTPLILSDPGEPREGSPASGVPRLSELPGSLVGGMLVAV